MAHYFDPKPEAGHQPLELAVRMRGLDFVFQTDRAVFSRHRLDFGSELLIETMIEDQAKPRGRLLDLGCGYGPVGIILKRLYPALDVVLCDINERALELARLNSRQNQVQYISIVQSDGLQAVSGPFDLILTNPPIRAGKVVVYRFFREAAERLAPGGVLYVVIQKKQGAPSALRYLGELFEQAAAIAHDGGYWIIRAAMPRAGSSDPAVPSDASELARAGADATKGGTTGGAAAGK
jgi:16S rRNA (guanine1207-N2)-methyltransferase